MVPNAPCGVESFGGESLSLETHLVPNAPCGVERLRSVATLSYSAPVVPNAPCGVESRKTLLLALMGIAFLMHRVELKVLYGLSLGYSSMRPFLMHRVELKD